MFFRSLKKGGQASKKIQKNTHFTFSLTQWLTKPQWESVCVCVCSECVLLLRHKSFLHTSTIFISLSSCFLRKKQWKRSFFFLCFSCSSLFSTNQLGFLPLHTLLLPLLKFLPFLHFPLQCLLPLQVLVKFLLFFFFFWFFTFFFPRQSCSRYCEILNVDTFLNKNVCVCFISYVFLFHLLSMSHYLFLSFLMMKLVFNSFKFKFENSIKALNADNI